MKPKKVDLYLIEMLLAAGLSLIDILVSLSNGESFTTNLFGLALFGYFSINYWKNGKIGGLKL